MTIGCLVGGGAAWQWRALERQATLVACRLADEAWDLAEAREAIQAEPFLAFQEREIPSLPERSALIAELSSQLAASLEARTLPSPIQEALPGLERAKDQARNIQAALQCNTLPSPADAGSRAADTDEGRHPASTTVNPFEAGLRRLAGLRARTRDELARARERIPTLRAEWDADRRLGCASGVQLDRLAAVRATLEARCNGRGRAGNPGCGAQAFAAIDAERAQEAEVHQLNQRKLRSKWGARLYDQIRCP